MAEPIRILIADDHPVVRAGIRGLLAAADGFAIVAEAAHGQEAVDLVGRVPVDVVLLDLRMPVLDGLAALKLIKARFPALPVLILTTYDTDHDVALAVAAGANGYLRKDAPPDELHRAIRTLASGGSALGAEIATRLLDQMRHPNALTEREIAIIQRVAQGESNKLIGHHLHISEATVKTHLNHIFAKLNVPDRAAAVAAAAQRGYLGPSTAAQQPGSD